MNPELRQAVDAVQDGFENFKTGLVERIEKLETIAGRPRRASSESADGLADLPEMKALDAYIRGIDTKTLVVGDDPTGGYFVPDVLQPSIIDKLYNPPTLLTLVRQQVWSGGGSEWIEPRRRAFVTASRRAGEAASAVDTSTTDPAALLRVPCGESEAMITISQKLLDDSAFDLAAMSYADMSAAFDRQIDLEIVSGTGVGDEGRGFLTVDITSDDDDTRPWGSIQYAVSGSATDVTADGLKDFVYTLRAPYRQGAAWVMNSATTAAVDKLKSSGSGEYFWRDSMASGQPPTLLGYPVWFDENMPAIAGGAYPIAFANWKMAYVVAKKSVTRFLRDPFTDKPNLTLYGYKRQGGAPANTEAIKLLKIST